METRTQGAYRVMLTPDEHSLSPRETDAPPDEKSNPAVEQSNPAVEQSNPAVEPSNPAVERSKAAVDLKRKETASYDGIIRLVGHRVREVQAGVIQVEAQISCRGRTFTGAASGPEAPPDRLRVPALATLRALDACLQIFYLGVSEPALHLDNVIEVSVGDFPVAVVMITASEKAMRTPLVAACPLVGMSDLAIILAALQATTRTASHWLAWGDRFPDAAGQDRPQ